MSAKKTPNSTVKGSAFFLIRSLNVGGTERQLVYLAKGLVARGCPVSVGVFYKGGPLDAELLEAGIPVVDLGKRGRWDFVGFWLRMVRAIRASKADVLYCFLGTANILGALAHPFLGGVRLVWSVRSSIMHLGNYDWLSRTSYQLECRLARMADLIISNSHAGLEHAAANGFPRAKMVVAHNGFDTARFAPNAALRTRARKAWGVADDQLVIGVLARIDPIKDYPTFLKCAVTVAKARTDVRFVCVGEGGPAYETEMKALSQSLGLGERIIWAGRSNNPPEVLNGFDVYCSPSGGEGFSNSNAEAMSCGLPCVVTDVGDMAALISDAGFVVPPHHPDAMAAALIEAIHAVGGPIGEAARRRVVESFSIEALVEQTEALLFPAAGARQP